MTSEQFAIKEKELLDRLPIEFRSDIGYMAYDRGHAYGFEGVLNLLSEMVGLLEPCIKKYTDRIKG